MHLGHLFLAVSLVSLGFIGIFFKVAASLKCRPSAINLTLFFWAAVLLSIYMGASGQIPLVLKTPSKLYLVAFICGMLASLAMLSFQAGLRYGKISTSWVIINLSTALPAVLSIWIYGETISLAKCIALILIVIAILLLWKDKELAGEAREHNQKTK